MVNNRPITGLVVLSRLLVFRLLLNYYYFAQNGSIKAYFRVVIVSNKSQTNKHYVLL